MRKVLLIFAILLFSSGTFVQAQTVINPTTAVFNASADHNVVENGINLVSNYELRVYRINETIVVKTLNLNKPTPDATNTIISDITSFVLSLVVGDYYATVVAKGPGGESVSAPSNPFQVSVRIPAAPTNLRITK